MKIAAFNVENLFDRPKAFNEDDPALTQETIKAVAELNSIYQEDEYEDTQKARILELIEQLELNDREEGPLAFIRRIRGTLLRRPRDGDPEVVAGGKADWVGWAELKTAPVDEIAVLNTGRVIRDVDAHILAVIEAEDRLALKTFDRFVLDRANDELPQGQRKEPYTSVMLIDGNDDRGIDVGLMTKGGYEIGEMRSHVNDVDDTDQIIYSRDCPEYAVATPRGERVWVLPNHFKSKFGGNDPKSVAKRDAQATRTAEVYQRLRDSGQNNVVVLGDLNDTPGSAALQPLLDGTDLRDVSEHPNFEVGEFNVAQGNNDRGIGTFGLGNDNQKIDYILLSPAFFDRVTSAGLWRKGAWPGSRPQRWEVYEQLTEDVHAASDHHAIWADID
jgi:endonuclease/exonuclease/phosphatase family metal-dependent hydrolase